MNVASDSATVPSASVTPESGAGCAGALAGVPDAVDCRAGAGAVALFVVMRCTWLLAGTRYGLCAAATWRGDAAAATATDEREASGIAAVAVLGTS